MGAVAKTTRIGPYRIEEPLGKGGMGEVFRAFDERLERPVAIKRLNAALGLGQQARERFWREARAIARLRHPAVIQIYDVLDRDDDPCIVMELVEGRTLASMLQRGPLPPPAAVTLFREIAEALAEAHEHGILHRDLKSENVMITDRGGIKILDFGLARRFLEDDDEARLTAEGRILGTVHAMSPEQARARELGPRSDLFSLGSLLYETVVGEHPFVGADAIVTLRQICEEEHLPAHVVEPRVPRPLSRYLDQLLQKDPADRPCDAHAVVEALSRLGGGTQEPSSTGDSLARALSGVPATSGSEAPTVMVTQRRRVQWGRATSGERRQITVVHCELASQEAGGSSSGALDLEELLDAEPLLQTLVKEVAERFGGRIGESLDSGARIYFGHPQAREDDARRAVYAARALVRGAESLADTAAGESWALQVGIHTGLVVAGAGGERRLVLGETAKVASGIQSLAPAGAVLLSETTRELVAPFVRTRALEPAAVPGLPRPIRTHRVLGEDNSDMMLPSRGPDPLVGRRQELELLCERWRLVEEGEGQAVLLDGEAGIGKSRLVRALHDRLKDRKPRWLWCRCTSIERHTPFAAVVNTLRRLTATDADGPETQQAALERRLRAIDADVDTALPALASLLQLGEETPAIDAWQRLSPEGRRQRLLEALVGLARQLARTGPILVVVEDLQWIDPSSLELLNLLIEQVPGNRVMLVLTCRPEFETPWRARAHLTHLSLGRLSRVQTEELIRTLTPAGQELMPETAAQIAERTDGVPLFIEEVTRAVAEAPSRRPPSSSDASPALPVPATLQDFLMAQLDRLGRAKSIAQEAAVLGRTFRLDLLAAISPLDDVALDAELSYLIENEVIVRQGVGASARYAFEHALVQEVAYQSLLRRERRRLHRRVAEALEERFPELVERRPEILAHHREKAGGHARAAELWLRAGRGASERCAFREAIGHLTKGLETLMASPGGRRRDETELALRIALGTTLMAVEGYAASEAESQYRRARELCGRVVRSARHFPALDGLFVYHFTRAEHETASELAVELLCLAEGEGNGELLLEACRIVGLSRLYRGDLDGAWASFERALGFAPERREASDLWLYPSDPLVNCHLCLAWIHAYRGRPRRAERSCRRGLALAEEIGLPFGLAMARCLAADLYLFLGRVERGREQADAAVALAEEQGFAFWRVIGTTVVAWARIAQGEVDAGREQLARALAIRRKMGVELGQPRFLGLLASVAEDAERGLEQVDEALARVEATGERLHEAGLHHVRGELLLSAGDPERARRSFERALEAARRQGVKAFERRAAKSLARLPRTAAG